MRESGRPRVETRDWKELNLAKKPAVRGTPANEAKLTVIMKAVRGCDLPRPRKTEISSLPRCMRRVARAKKAMRVAMPYANR